jgi:DNA-directed RNA polymerase specialized sigma24 family protein
MTANRWATPMTLAEMAANCGDEQFARICRAALSMRSNLDLIEDAVQETALATLEAAAKTPDQVVKVPATWITTVAKRIGLRMLQKEERTSKTDAGSPRKGVRDRGTDRATVDMLHHRHGGPARPEGHGPDRYELKPTELYTCQ